MIVTIGLGIGINTTVFTLVDAVFFKPVDVPNGDRLVAVSGQDLTMFEIATLTGAVEKSLVPQSLR